MSTQNLVPRGDGSGSLGTSAKKWGNAYFNSMSVSFSTLSGSFSGSYSGDGSSLTGIVATVVEPISVDFNTASANPEYREGRLFYDNTEKALSYYNNESDVTLNIGQEEYLLARNDTGETILNGTPVRISGAQGQNPKIIKAQSTIHVDVEAELNEIIGLATHDIEHSTDGFVTTAGIVRMDTTDYTLGDILYVSSSEGELTATRPDPPYDIIKVGTVTYINANNGKVLVSPREPIHFHDISGLTNTENKPDKARIHFESGSDQWSISTEIQLSNGVHLVSGSSSTRYTSLSGALSNSTNGDTVLVTPGTYYESDLYVPNGVRVLGSTGYGGDVTILSTTSSNYTMRLGNGSILSYVQLIGANNSNPIVQMDSDKNISGAPLIQTARILGGGNSSQIGVYVSGSGFNSIINSSFANGTGMMGDAIKFEGDSDSELFIRDVLFAGSGSRCINMSGDTIGLGDGKININSAKALGVQADYKYGFGLHNSGSIEAVGVSFNENVTSSMHFASGSDGITVRMNSAQLRGTTYDIEVDSVLTGVGTEFNFASLNTRQERFQDNSGGTWLAGASFVGNWVDEGTSDDPSVAVLGEFHVGLPGRGAESSFGEGESSTLNMKIFHSGSTGWVDHTENAKTIENASFTAFPDSGSGATLYFGNTTRKFPNMKVVIDTPQTGSNIAGVWEYYSASTWSEFNVHATYADYPYTDTGKGVFNVPNDEQLRFEDIFSAQSTKGWVTGSVNGTNAYWVRYRLTSALSSSAVFDRVKIGTNRTEINTDGVVEFFGTAIQSRKIPWHQKLTYTLNGSTPSDSTINYSANVSLDYADNTFTSNARDGAGGIIAIPTGLDTSRKITLELYWIASANGSPSNIEMELDVVQVKLGDTIDGSLTEQSFSEIIEIGTSDSGVLRKTSFDIDVSDLIEGEFIALSYFRDATAGNTDDTFNGSISILKTDVIGYFWR